MLAAIKSFFGAMWSGGATDDAGGGYNTPAFFDNTGAEYGYGAGSRVSDFGEGFGASEIRAGEATYEHRLQNTREANRARNALNHGATDEAQTIIARNPDVGIERGGVKLYGRDAAQFLATQQEQMRQLLAAQQGIDRTDSLKSDLNTRLNNDQTNAANNARMFDGGAINIPVKAGDTQWDVVQRSLAAFAERSGLPPEEQKRFIADWTNKLRAGGETSLYDYTTAGKQPISAAEFAAYKASGEFPSYLTPDRQPAIVADLQNRLGEAYSESISVDIHDAQQRAQQEARRAEGVGAFFSGAVAGDFSDNESWSKTGGQVAVGLIPVVGQIADARDTAAAIKDVAQGKDGAWINLGAAAIGWIPLIGDGAKAGLRVGRRILKESEKEVAEAVVKRAAKEGIELTEAAAKEATERALKEEAVLGRLDELAVQGHGPQRHSSHITEQQLEDRAVKGFDPVTGTTHDAYNKFPDGTPKPHGYSKDATKIVSDEAYVNAETYVRNSQGFNDLVAEADRVGGDEVTVKSIKLEDVFGVNYTEDVFGKTRIGSKSNPSGVANTDFTDGTITAIYRKESNGKWNLYTMYPDPKK